MPIYLQAIFALTMLVGLSMCVLLFYFKNQAQMDVLAARLARGLKRLAGANWRTTLTGFGTAVFGTLTILSALPEDLGTMADVIPPTWKPNIIKVSLAAAGLLHILNAFFQKDKSVSGGAITQDKFGNVSAIQPPIDNPPLPALPHQS